MLPGLDDVERAAGQQPLVPGLATGVGSLPHLDRREAVDLVLRATPDLPAVPQLPRLDPREGVVAQWARAIPGVEVERDGTLLVRGDLGPPSPDFDRPEHETTHAFLATVARADIPPARVKAQVVGPLTLGVALERAGVRSATAFEIAAATVAAWVRALERLVTAAVPNASLLVLLDEPALVLWRREEEPLPREAAMDLLSGCLVGGRVAMGVHVCGEGDVRLAYEAGPAVLGVAVSDALIADADVLARHLDAGGWIAWGAVPTDRPLGDGVDGLWRRLAVLWCELARRGCDGMRLRTQALVTPACGLAGFGPTQAERALRLTHTLATRIHDQAAAARLTVGA